MGTSSRFFSHLLVEVVYVEIIICMIREDLSVDRTGALLVLEDRDAMEYGGLVENEEIVRCSTKKRARVV